ncbi:MAG TPA: carboxy terminal-processing peptidase [Polyangia bacterium]|jgi:carboxyl-terminal processing protease|nr:carboxy terminal-processing peptidase [Polyangia bacterium]
MKVSVRVAAASIALGMVIVLVGMSRAGQPARPADVQATDANVTRLTTSLLGHSQFSHHPLDAELAGRLLDRYLAALDGTRSLFLQSDVDEFAKYRATLAQATMMTGDTSAARAIFARYLQRLEQEVAFSDQLLKANKFDFTGHDAYSFDRERAARPTDLAAAHALWQQQLRAEYLEEKLTDKPPAQIVTFLQRRHEQQLRTMKGLRDDEVLETYLDALAHVYDPHSDYLGHEEMQDLSIAMNLSLFGIGAALESEDGYTKIRELIPGGPAARSGLLKGGDRITAVAQAGKDPVDIINMPLSRAVELIRGPKGTKVTLTIVSEEGALPKTVPLVRDEIKLADQAAKARIIELPAAKGTLRVGVIDLPSFYADMGGTGASHRSATEDVARLLKKLVKENVRGIVMDVRRNGGGSLEEAITLTGLFIRKGPVVQTRDSNGSIEVGTDDDGKVLYDGPLVLLTSRFSASATEIMVGALQDYGRGVVVGDSSTFGKGTVQSIVGLAPIMDRAGLGHAYDPGALKITISKFYRPSGSSTQLRGVASDIILPSTTDFADVSEAKLKDPLPWDTVPAKPYDRLNRVQAYVGQLRDGSSKRVKTDPGFAYLAGEIDRLGKNLSSKSVSLNEAERRKEMAAEKARKAQHDIDLRARVATRPVAYAITLDNADAPGLPAPIVVKIPPLATGAAAKKVHGSDEASDDDVILDEGQRILSDYVGFLETAAASAVHHAAR